MYIMKKILRTEEVLVVARVDDRSKDQYWDRDADVMSNIGKEPVEEVLEKWRPLTEIEVALYSK